MSVPSRLLAESLDEAIDLIQAFVDVHAPPSGDLRPLASLADQCEALVAANPGPEPVRLLHHFACTGGSLLSKLVALMPNTLLLSEIDPLSTLALNRNAPRFAPTDLIYGMRVALRPSDDAAVLKVFLAGLEALHAETGMQGRRLVLRDHSHSHFCTRTEIHGRQTLREILSPRFDCLSLVTVRHPLDSFAALDRNRWTHFDPFTLDEYAARYRAFLDRHADCPVIRYEDLVAAPDTTLAQICDTLRLPFAPEATDLLSVVAVSGDSGRSGSDIRPRPRRPMPDWILQQARTSRQYGALCEGLGYDPAP